MEGEAYYQRCAAILAELEDANQGLAGAVAGLLRPDVAGSLARLPLLPALPDFLAAHPRLTIHLGEGVRVVNLVRDGVDCVVRAGEVDDSGMIARHLGTMQAITCASPADIAAHGTPIVPDRLDGHHMIAFVSSRTGQAPPLEFLVDGENVEVILPRADSRQRGRHQRHSGANGLRFRSGPTPTVRGRSRLGGARRSPGRL